MYAPKLPDKKLAPVKSSGATSSTDVVVAASNGFTVTSSTPAKVAGLKASNPPVVTPVIPSTEVVSGAPMR